MAYTINHYNNSPLLLNGLTDGTVDHSTSLSLVGRDTPNYGQYINENFVYLLENFSGGSTPSNPVTGQLWWDSNNKILKVNAGANGQTAKWINTMGANAAPSTNPPTSSAEITGSGTLWYDTSNQQLNVWAGTEWITVGPFGQSPLGETGATYGSIVDTNQASHPVIIFQISGVPYAIFSKDAFSTTSVAGFTNIIPGLNFSTTNPLGIANQAVNSTQIPQALSVVSVTTSQGINSGSTVRAPAFAGPTGQTATFTGQLNGNVSAYTVSAVTNITSAAFTATSGYQGNVLTGSQPFITTLSNITVGNIALTGNISYTPSVPSNWNSPIPTTVRAALDQIAARMKLAGI
jgi:hypothetical protein